MRIDTAKKILNDLTAEGLSLVRATTALGEIRHGLYGSRAGRQLFFGSIEYMGILKHPFITYVVDHKLGRLYYDQTGHWRYNAFTASVVPRKTMQKIKIVVPHTFVPEILAAALRRYPVVRNVVCTGPRTVLVELKHESAHVK